MTVLGEFGTELMMIEVSPQVVALVVTDGRLVAPESTGVTRISYVVALDKPVRVADVRDELGVWAHSDHADVFASRYSTL